MLLEILHSMGRRRILDETAQIRVRLTASVFKLSKGV
jgi:hypothetical protein